MKFNTKTIVKIAIISALSYVIMLIEIPVPFIIPFLKIDLSEIPVLLAAFSLGPISAILVELIKNTLHIFNTQTAGVGELANFLIGISLVIPVSLVYIQNKSKKGAVIGLIVGTLSMVIFASLFNYFALLPLYAKVLGFSAKDMIDLSKNITPWIKDIKTFIVFSIIPFNLLKGAIVSLVVIVIYKKLSPILHR